MASLPVAEQSARFRWLFLLNAIIIAVLSLPLLFAYPAVFGRLGIASLENGFFVRLAAGWLFVEAIASYLVWRRMAGNNDLVWIIVAMKVVAIVVIVVAAFSGTLPATSLLLGAAYDIVMSIAFCVYLSREAGR
jgi:hypothetical protein